MSGTYLCTKYINKTTRNIRHNYYIRSENHTVELWITVSSYHRDMAVFFHHRRVFRSLVWHFSPFFGKNRTEQRHCNAKCILRRGWFQTRGECNQRKSNPLDIIIQFELVGVSLSVRLIKTNRYFYGCDATTRRRGNRTYNGRTRNDEHDEMDFRIRNLVCFV